MASDEARARFQQEAQAAAQLNHPNVATVYQIGEVPCIGVLALMRRDAASLARVKSNLEEDTTITSNTLVHLLNSRWYLYDGQ